MNTFSKKFAPSTPQRNFEKSVAPQYAANCL
jgi:hypothetical protein